MSKTKLLVQKGGPGGYDIYVDPTALRTVTTYLQSRLQKFGGKQQAFASGTPHQDGEFGKLPLPETTHVNDQYTQSQKDAVQSLQDMATWLVLIGGALTTSADDYEKADGVTG